MFSYSHVLDYDSSGVTYGMRDVDCQIALLDFINQKRIVLSTFGPAMEFQDAYWLNKDTLIVTGIENDIDDTFIPYYCLIDLTTFLVRYYQQEKELKLEDNTYLERVFEGIEFE